MHKLTGLVLNQLMNRAIDLGLFALAEETLKTIKVSTNKSTKEFHAELRSLCKLFLQHDLFHEGAILLNVMSFDTEPEQTPIVLRDYHTKKKLTTKSTTGKSIISPKTEAEKTAKSLLFQYDNKKLIYGDYKSYSLVTLLTLITLYQSEGELTCFEVFKFSQQYTDLLPHKESLNWTSKYKSNQICLRGRINSALRHLANKSLVEVSKSVCYPRGLKYQLPETIRTAFSPVAAQLGLP